LLIDLHVHSRHTPGCSLDPAEILRRAEALGLDGVCFTDQGTLAGAAELQALRATTRLRVLVGLEVATDHGHYLCFFERPQATPEPAALFGAPVPGRPWPVREVIEKVRERGGVCVAAHPYDRDVEKPAGDFIFTLRGLGAIEGLNGRRRTNVNELAIEAADHLALPCVGGSGAIGSLDELGTAATLFRDEFADEAGLVAALRGGAVWAVAIGTPPALGEPGPGPRPARHERYGEGRDRRDRERGRRRGRHGGGEHRDEHRERGAEPREHRAERRAESQESEPRGDGPHRDENRPLGAGEPRGEGHRRRRRRRGGGGGSGGGGGRGGGEG
jgi:predicted metal-dependent phosphoesterase TrpH